MNMKRTNETNGCDNEVDGKKTKISNGHGASGGGDVKNNGDSLSKGKCSICLWPVGAVQCYHSAHQMETGPR